MCISWRFRIVLFTVTCNRYHVTATSYNRFSWCASLRWMVSACEESAPVSKAGMVLPQLNNSRVEPRNPALTSSRVHAMLGNLEFSRASSVAVYIRSVVPAPFNTIVIHVSIIRCCLIVVAILPLLSREAILVMRATAFYLLFAGSFYMVSQSLLYR